MTTMYKIASTSNANTLMRNPTLYVQNDTSTIRIVDVKKEFVNKNLTGQEESNPSILYRTAYHGTPHNFDRFSTSAIGTGEGALSFGWGLYFTNQEDIARWYADKLSPVKVKKEY